MLYYLTPAGSMIFIGLVLLAYFRIFLYPKTQQLNAVAYLGITSIILSAFPLIGIAGQFGLPTKKVPLYKCIKKNPNPGFFSSDCLEKKQIGLHWARAPFRGYIFTTIQYKQYLEQETLKEQLETLQIENEIKIGRVKAEMALIDQQIENAKTINDTIPNNLLARKKEAQDKLVAIQTAPLTPKNKPQDSKTEFLLSVLGLAVAFFTQRILEKAFDNKGYAILAVCLLGALVAFFTANYFIFGSIIGGGVMGGSASSS